jgi:hypothetical protein
VNKLLSDMRTTGIDSITMYNTSREGMQRLPRTITHTLKRLVRSSTDLERPFLAEQLTLYMLRRCDWDLLHSLPACRLKQAEGRDDRFYS